MKRLFSRKPKNKLGDGHSRNEIAPEEIFLDAGNLPKFDVYQFEGRLEKPISRRIIIITGAFFLLICLTLLARAYALQVNNGEEYRILGEKNSLRSSVIFAPRGLIEDRNGIALVSNKSNEVHPEYPSREYIAGSGFAHLLGFVSYPKKDTSGVYFREDYIGKSGVEAYYDALLKGQNGLKISEENALGEIESESVARFPRSGMKLTLSVDSLLQRKLHSLMRALSVERGFSGGAAALMDVSSGEILALTSFPEFDSTIISEGENDKSINEYITDKREPFLDRAVDGLYTPGSVVKPFIAVGALIEKIITPDKRILSTGSISIPNPYNPDKKSVFRDWKAHGYVDMREAIAVSSDVYFYEVGGGFEDQQGLGIGRLKKYFKLFGLGTAEDGNFLLDVAGTIPDPAWKAEKFDGEPWRIGDTYNTSIGQYGMQVTPVQAVRAIAAIANGGTLLEPTVIKDGNRGRNFERQLGIPSEVLSVVQDGMRGAVLFGTALNLNVWSVEVAAKTGTAELGANKQYVNSWVVGFFPYEKPRYAFAVLMERGPHDNTVGALYVMRQFMDWLPTEAPEYIARPLD